MNMFELVLALAFVKYIIVPIVGVIALILVIMFVQAVIGVKETSEAVGNDAGRAFDNILDRMFAPYIKPKHWAEVDRWFEVYQDHWYHKWLRRNQKSRQ